MLSDAFRMCVQQRPSLTLLFLPIVGQPLMLRKSSLRVFGSENGCSIGVISFLLYTKQCNSLCTPSRLPAHVCQGYHEGLCLLREAKGGTSSKVPI